MNNKAKKTFYIVLVSILGTGAIAFALCYFVFIPEQTKEFIASAWVWANQPLPVVGVSFALIAFFLWKVFISTSFGNRKYNQVKSEFAALLEEFRSFVSNADEKEKELKEQIESLKAKNKILVDYINQIKNAIPNKKVKEIAEITENEREEETNN